MPINKTDIERWKAAKEKGTLPPKPPRPQAAAPAPSSPTVAPIPPKAKPAWSGTGRSWEPEPLGPPTPEGYNEAPSRSGYLSEIGAGAYQGVRHGIPEMAAQTGEVINRYAPEAPYLLAENLPGIGPFVKGAEALGVELPGREQAAQVGRDWEATSHQQVTEPIQEKAANAPTGQMSQEAMLNPHRRMAYQGAQSLGPSVAAMAATIANPAVGASATFGAFASSGRQARLEQLQSAREEIDRQRSDKGMEPITTEELEHIANVSGFWQGASESIGDLVGLGVAGAIGKVGARGVVKAAGSLPARLVGSTATEIGEEVVPMTGDYISNRSLGIKQDDYLTQLAETAETTLYSAGILGGAGTAVGTARMGVVAHGLDQRAKTVEAQDRELATAIRADAATIRKGIIGKPVPATATATLMRERKAKEAAATGDQEMARAIAQDVGAIRQGQPPKAEAAVRAKRLTNLDQSIANPLVTTEQKDRIRKNKAKLEQEQAAEQQAVAALTQPEAAAPAPAPVTPAPGAPAEDQFREKINQAVAKHGPEAVRRQRARLAAAPGYSDEVFDELTMAPSAQPEPAPAETPAPAPVAEAPAAPAAIAPQEEPEARPAPQMAEPAPVVAPEPEAPPAAAPVAEPLQEYGDQYAGWRKPGEKPKKTVADLVREKEQANPAAPVPAGLTYKDWLAAAHPDVPFGSYKMSSETGKRLQAEFQNYKQGQETPAPVIDQNINPESTTNTGESITPDAAATPAPPVTEQPVKAAVQEVPFGEVVSEANPIDPLVLNDPALADAVSRYNQTGHAEEFGPLTVDEAAGMSPEDRREILPDYVEPISEEVIRKAQKAEPSAQKARNIAMREMRTDMPNLRNILTDLLETREDVPLMELLEESGIPSGLWINELSKFGGDYLVSHIKNTRLGLEENLGALWQEKDVLKRLGITNKMLAKYGLYGIDEGKAEGKPKAGYRKPDTTVQHVMFSRVRALWTNPFADNAKPQDIDSLEGTELEQYLWDATMREDEIEANPIELPAWIRAMGRSSEAQTTRAAMEAKENERLADLERIEEAFAEIEEEIKQEKAEQDSAHVDVTIVSDLGNTVFKPDMNHFERIRNTARKYLQNLTGAKLHLIGHGAMDLQGFDRAIDQMDADGIEYALEKVYLVNYDESDPRSVSLVGRMLLRPALDAGGIIGVDGKHIFIAWPGLNLKARDAAFRAPVEKLARWSANMLLAASNNTTPLGFVAGFGQKNSKTSFRDTRLAAANKEKDSVARFIERLIEADEAANGNLDNGRFAHLTKELSDGAINERISQRNERERQKNVGGGIGAGAGPAAVPVLGGNQAPGQPSPQNAGVPLPGVTRAAGNQNASTVTLIVKSQGKPGAKGSLTAAGARTVLADTIKRFKGLVGKVDLYRNAAEYLADPKGHADDKADIKRESSIGGAIEGFYSPRTGLITIFTDNIKDANRMKVVMASHESYHAFMDTVLGTQAARQFHLSVWNEFKDGGDGIVGVREFAETHGIDVSDADGRALAAEEWVAKHAENGKFTEAGLKGLWNKIVAMIRRGWLKIHPTASLTENDVAFMLRGTVGAKIREANQWAMGNETKVQAPMFRPYQAGITKLEKHFKRHPEMYNNVLYSLFRKGQRGQVLANEGISKRGIEALDNGLFRGPDLAKALGISQAALNQHLKQRGQEWHHELNDRGKMERVDYYDISAITPEELASAMNHTLWLKWQKEKNKKGVAYSEAETEEYNRLIDERDNLLDTPNKDGLKQVEQALADTAIGRNLAKRESAWRELKNAVASDTKWIESVLDRQDGEMRFSIETAGANLNDPADVTEAARLWAELGTESPYFKRWFGDSKVVDANGKPLVVYHGTEQSFNSFDFTKIGRPGNGYGFHFAESPVLAKHYANQLGVGITGKPKGAMIYPVYLNIRNPFTGDYYKFAAEHGLYGNFRADDVRDELIKLGYDGIVYDHGKWEGMEKESPIAYVAFSPSQIKSATGNRGTFDAGNPDIRMSAAGYKTNHRPDEDGPSANNLLQGDMAPRDIYEHPDWYGRTGIVLKETMAVLRQARGNPNAEITIYRTSPVRELNPGDWVTMSISYAEEHGRHPSDAALDQKPHAYRVKAKDVRWAGDDLAEWGYFPADNQTRFSKSPKQRVVSYETASGETRQAIENVEETPSDALPGQVDMFTGEVVKEPPKPAPKPKQAALAATEDNPLQNDRDTERALKAKADAELADEKARLKSIPAAVDIEAEFFQPEKKQQTLFSKAPANQDEAFGFDLLPESWGQGIRRMVQDQFLRVLTVQKTIEKATGAPLPESSNPYLKEELANALASDKVRRFQDTHIEPLIKAIKASGLTVPEVEDYLLALHAPERNARIAFRNDKFNSPEEKGGAGISNARAAEIRAEIEARIAPEKLDAIRQAVRKIVAFERKTRLDAGLITPKQLDRWIKGDEIAPEDAAVLDEFGLPVPTPWEDYVPLKIDQQGQPARPRVGRGWGVRGKETKAAFGHEAPGEDILGHLLTQSYESVLRAEKNEVGKALLNLVRENPNPAVWEINKTRPVPKENPETGETEWRSVKEIAENTMSVKVDGQEVFITLHDPLLARAFMRLDAPTSNVIVKALGAIGRVWAKLQTQWSPTFAVRNFIRDYVTGNINLFAEKGTAFTGRVAATTPLAVEGIARYMAGNRSKLNPWGRHYEEFQQAGGRIEYLGLRNVETARKELLRAVQETGANPWVITKKVGRSLLQILEGLNTAIENGVRLAAFVEARRRGDSPTQAASLARNLTVNFDRRGEWGVALNSMYVFANANIQGSARMLKALKSPSVWGLLGSWVAFSFALAELNRVAGGDDDDDIPYYDKIEDWEKEKHFIIMRPGTGGKFFKIPLPYGYNIFHVLGTSANAAMHGQDPWQSAASTVVSIMSAFNPLGGERSDDPAKSLVKTLSPTMVDPFVQLGFNENFFGASIMPDKQAFPGQVPKPDSERYFPSATSPVAVSVARKLNELSGGNRVRSGKVDVSPATIEHFYNYFVGGAGRFVSQSYDALNNTTGEPLAPHKIPFKQIFLGQPGEYRISKAYRSNLMEVKTAVDEFKMLAEDDPARARQYLNDNRKLLRLYMTQEQVTSTLRGQEPPRTNSYQQKPAAKDIAKRLSDLDDQLDKAKAAGNIEREKRIRKERNELMTRFNREVNRVTGRNVQKPIPYVTEAAEAVVGVRSGR